MDRYISSFVEKHKSLSIGENISDPADILSVYTNHIRGMMGGFSPDVVYVLDALNLTRSVTFKPEAEGTMIKSYSDEIDEIDQISVFLSIFISMIMKHNSENSRSKILFDIVFRLPRYEEGICNHIIMLKQMLLTLDKSEFNEDGKHEVILSACFPTKHYGDGKKSVKKKIGDIDDLVALKKTFYYRKLGYSAHVVACDRNVSNNIPPPGNIGNIIPSVQLVDNELLIHLKPPLVDVLEVNFIINNGYRADMDSPSDIFKMFTIKHLSNSFYCLESVSIHRNIVLPPCQILDCVEGTYERLTKVLGLELACRESRLYNEDIFKRLNIDVSDITPRAVVFSTSYVDQIARNLFDKYMSLTQREKEVSNNNSNPGNTVEKELIEKCIQGLYTTTGITPESGERYMKMMKDYFELVDQSTGSLRDPS